MEAERELLLEIRNAQIANDRRLERIERRLGLLGQRRELERQLAEDWAGRMERVERGSGLVARLRRKSRPAPAVLPNDGTSAGNPEPGTQP